MDRCAVSRGVRKLSIVFAQVAVLALIAGGQPGCGGSGAPSAHTIADVKPAKGRPPGHVARHGPRSLAHRVRQRQARDRYTAAAGRAALAAAVPVAQGSNTAATPKQAAPAGQPSSGQLGLEKFYQYTGVDTGSGSSLLNNDDTGNVVWNYNPFSNPSRGFQTFVRIDYNSMDTTESAMGFGWSLQASTLQRLGTPLEFHPRPHPATVTLTDGDGTTHTFTLDPATGAWISPPGLHYFLQQVADCPPNGKGTTARAWLMTAPDRTQFYFDCQGYQSAIVDKNGNTAGFTYSIDSNGQPGKLLDYITDPSGRRTLTITYYAKGQSYSYIDSDGNVASGHNLNDPHIIGQVYSVTDVSGRTITFLYDTHGFMSQMTDGDGTALAKVFRFGYSKPEGIGNNRLVSVTDPRRNTTRLSYFTASEDPKYKGSLESITDPIGRTTGFSYAQRPDGDVQTAVTDPKGHVSAYLMDASGRPVQDTNALRQTTMLSWDTDNNVTALTEADGARTTWTYDPLTGYPLTMTDAQANHDGTPGYVYRYQSGLSGHTANLISELTPQGRLWTFGYDPRGNLTTVTQPLGNVSGAVPGAYTTRYTYDSSGDVLTSTDPDGNITKSSGYGPAGYPGTMTDPLGHATSYVYSPTGNVTAVTDPLGNTTTQAYDIFGRPGRQVVPKTKTVSIITPAPVYDGDDNVTTSFAPNGAATTYTYDADSELVKQVAPPETPASPAPATTYTYDADGNLGSQTSPDGNVPGAKPGSYTITFSYDAINEQTAVTDPSDGVTRSAYNNVGDLTSTADPNGNTTTYAYNLNHQLTQATDPAGHTTKTGYDLDGLTTSSTDQNGNTTRYTLDADGNVTQQQVPAQAPGAAVSYDTSRYVYDQNGNQTEVISPRGVASGISGAYTTRTVYNADSQVSAQFSAYNPDQPGFRTPAQTDYAYDADGRLSSVSAPPSGSQSIRNVTGYRYFANGWVQSSTDPWGITTSYDYNDLGEQSSRTITSSGGAMSRTQSWGYYPDGKLASVSDDGVPTGLYAEVVNDSDASNASSTGSWATAPCTANPADCEGYQYQAHAAGPGSDAFTWHLNIPADGNYTVYVKYPAVSGAAANAAFTVNYSGGSATVKVDQTKPGDWVPLGKWAFTKAGTRQQVSLAENNSGTVVADAIEVVRDNSGDTNTAKHTDTYTYDADGNQTGIADTGMGATVTKYTMAYDQLDRNTSVTEDNQAGTAVHTTTYGYDADSNLIARAHDRAPSTYTYNNLSQLVKESDARSSSDNSPQVTTFTYTPTGQPATEVKPNGNTVTFAYYANQLPQNQTENTSAGTLVSSHAYSYDPDGNKSQDIQKLMSADDSGSYLNHILTYTYDPMDQIQTVATDGKVTESYAHDADSNVTAQTINGTTTSYDYVLDRLETATSGGVSSDYNYDPFGRLDTVTSGARTLETNTYDGFDNITAHGQFNTRTGALDTTTYTYDPLNRQTSQTTSAGTTSFSYLGLSTAVSSESDPGGQTKSYDYTPAGMRTSQTTTSSDGTSTPGYYTYNDHADVDAVTGPTGTTTATYGYTAYGDPVQAMTTGKDKNNASPGSTATPYNSYRFNAMRWDSSSGQYDMGFRDYDPGLNQFVSRDMYDGALNDMGLDTNPFTGARYAFGDGNPISSIELDGHTHCDAGYCPTLQQTEQVTQRAAAQGAGCPGSEAGCPGYTPPSSGGCGFLGWHCAVQQGGNLLGGALNSLSDSVTVPATRIGCAFAHLAPSVSPDGRITLGTPANCNPPRIPVGDPNSFAYKFGYIITPFILAAVSAAESLAAGAAEAGDEAGAAAASGRAGPGAEPNGGADDPAAAGICGGGDSFTAGTKVLLASGKAVPIATLKPGDKVLATNTKTGKTQAETVTAVLVRHDTDLYDLHIKTAHGTAVIHTTSNHLFWDPSLSKWVRAAALKNGEHLQAPDGTTATADGGTVPANHQGWMWDLTIPGDGDHDFYVVADTPAGFALVPAYALLVHNDDSPVGTVFRDGPYRFQIYSNDHPPAHGHLLGPGIRGDGIQIGQNGKPIDPNVTLTPAQQKVIDENLGTIRKAIGRYMAWYRNNACG